MTDRERSSKPSSEDTDSRDEGRAEEREPADSDEGESESAKREDTPVPAATRRARHHREEDHARTPMPVRIERVRMMDSRKFKAMMLAVGVLTIPLLLTYSLCLKGIAKFSDLMELSKWMGGSLAPVFIAYIGGVAYEKAKTPPT